jgi:hypothetical protein
VTGTTTERVVLRSGGDEVVGTLVLPAGRPRGAVVATGPLTSVKEQASGVYAHAPVPAIVVHSERALVPPWAHAFHDALPGSRREVWLESDGQIDFYDDPALIGPATDAVVGFLDEMASRTSPKSEARPKNS